MHTFRLWCCIVSNTSYSGLFSTVIRTVPKEQYSFLKLFWLFVTWILCMSGWAPTDWWSDRDRDGGRPDSISDAAGDTGAVPWRSPVRGSSRAQGLGFGSVWEWRPGVNSNGRPGQGGLCCSGQASVETHSSSAARTPAPREQYHQGPELPDGGAASARRSWRL